LIHMAEDELALEKAIESGDTDLVFLVLLHIRRSKAEQDFFRILKNKPEANSLLIQYCKQMDHTLLKKLYTYSGRDSEIVDLEVQEALQSKDVETRVKGLKSGMQFYSQIKQSFSEKSTQTEVSLLLLQRELEANFQGKPFMGTSVSETLYRCVALGDLNRAKKIQSEFKIPDKRFYWIVIKAYGDTKEWAALEKFAKSKKPPIGFRPFAETCIEQKMVAEAVKYIGSITDPNERFQLYQQIEYWKEAAEVAVEMKNLDLAAQICNRMSSRADQEYIQNLIKVENKPRIKKRGRV